MHHPSKLVMDPSEVAASLGLCERTVYRLLDTGDIPSVRLGRRRLVRVAALEQRLAELEQQ